LRVRAQPGDVEVSLRAVGSIIARNVGGPMLTGRSYVHQLKAENETMSSQITSAHERIQQLEMILSSVDTGASHPGQDQDHRATFPSQAQGEHTTSGLGVGVGGGHSPRADFQALAKNILSVRSTSFANPVFGAVPIDALHPGRRPSSQQSSTTQPGAHGEQPTQAPYPPYQLALQAVETFFICNAISYPFLDKAEFLRDMDDLYSRASTAAPGGNAELSTDQAEVMAGKEFVLFMVIAIGTTNKERMGEVERGTSKVFRSRAMLGLTAAVSKEDIVSDFMRSSLRERTDSSPSCVFSRSSCSGFTPCSTPLVSHSGMSSASPPAWPLHWACTAAPTMPAYLPG
jgi:hypothetical protein